MSSKGQFLKTISIVRCKLIIETIALCTESASALANDILICHSHITNDQSTDRSMHLRANLPYLEQMNSFHFDWIFIYVWHVNVFDRERMSQWNDFRYTCFNRLEVCIVCIRFGHWIFSKWAINVCVSIYKIIHIARLPNCLHSNKSKSWACNCLQIYQSHLHLVAVCHHTQKNLFEHSCKTS